MSTDEYKFRIPVFQSGINQSTDDSLLKAYESPNAYNVNMEDGTCKSFKVPKKKTYIYDVGTVATYYGDKTYLICFTSNAIYKIDGDSYVKIYDAFGKFANALNYAMGDKKILIACSEGQIPMYYDGTTWTKLKNRYPVYDDSGTLTGYYDAKGKLHKTEDTVETYAPKGGSITLHYDRIWISNIPTEPNMIYYSAYDTYGRDIQNFINPSTPGLQGTMGGFIKVDTFDGTNLIGTKKIFDDIIIFKNKSVHRIYGSSPSNYQKVQMFQANGAIAEKSVVSSNKGCFWLSNDGIYFFDGTNVNCISAKIEGILRQLTSSYATNACGYFVNNRYYLAIPISESKNNNVFIEYNTLTGAFMYYNDININSFTDLYNEVIYGSDTGIYTLFAKDGLSKNMYWSTPLSDIQAKNTKKIFSYIYFTGSGTGDVKFTLKTERKDAVVQVTLDGTEKIYRKKLKNKGRNFQLLIENINGSNIEVKGIELVYEADVD